MHFVRVILGMACLLGISTTGLAQGIPWSVPYEAAETSMSRDPGTGDIYVVSIENLASFIHPEVARYSANGLLIDRASYGSGQGFFTDIQILATDFRNGLLKVIYSASHSNQDSEGTFIATYNPATSSLSKIDIKYLAENFRSTGAAFSASTYCVVGNRNSDNKGIVQVRLTSNNSILHEYLLPDKRALLCVESGTDSFVSAGFTYISPSSILHVEKIGSSSHTSYNYAIPSTGKMQVTMNASRSTLYVGVDEYDFATSDFDCRIYPFRMSSNVLSPPFVLNSSTTQEEIIAMHPIGASSMVFVIKGNIYGLSSSGTQIFTGNVLGNPYSIQTITDTAGNVVFLYHLSGILVGTRITPAGVMLNQFKFVDLKVYPTDVTIDASGTMRALYYASPISWAIDRSLAQINPATLTLPGPYTVGGDNLIGTISIGEAAPPGGATFELFSNNAAATVPATMTIPAGQVSGTFTINTTAVASNTKPLINARYSGLILQSDFDLAAPLIQSVSANPQSQYGGVNIVGTVNLTGKAPTGGKVVSLSSSNTAKATVPSSTTLSAGSTGKTFIITTVPTLVNASSVITATTGAVSKTVFIAINAPVLLAATLATSSIQGGLSTTMTTTLNAKAPSGYTVTLLSGSQLFVQLPSSYAIPAGAMSANIPVTTSDVSTTTPITLVAYRGPYVKTMTLTLTP